MIELFHPRQRHSLDKLLLCEEKHNKQGYRCKHGCRHNQCSTSAAFSTSDHKKKLPFRSSQTLWDSSFEFELL
ncbi:hypothetical protein PAAL109150_11175 [Paenibacillus alkaliterrae]